MSTIQLRIARADDAPAAAKVKAAAAVRAYGSFADTAELTAWLRHRADPEFIRRRITGPDPTARFLVAVDGDNIVGAGLIRAEGDDGYLADVYCDPPGTGAGTAIVEALLRHAITAGWANVRCLVLAGNTDAVRFFERFGFHTVDRIPNQEMRGDLLEMVR